MIKNCLKCGAKLPVKFLGEDGENRFIVSIARFPEDDNQIALSFLIGPGYVACHRCLTTAEIGTGMLILGSELAILFVDRDYSSKESSFRRLERNLSESLGTRKLVVTTTSKELRRAFLSTFVVPEFRKFEAAIEIQDEDAPGLEYFESLLQPEFLCAMYVLLSGAVEIISVPIGTDLDAVNDVAASESVATKEKTLARRREVLLKQKQRFGFFLAKGVLQHVQVQLGDGKSPEHTLPKVLKQLASRHIDDETFTAINAYFYFHIEAASRKNDSDVIFQLELALALFCWHLGRANSRLDAWTESYVEKEFRRALEPKVSKPILSDELARAILGSAHLPVVRDKLVRTFELFKIDTTNVEKFNLLTSILRRFSDSIHLVPTLKISFSEYGNTEKFLDGVKEFIAKTIDSTSLLEVALMILEGMEGDGNFYRLEPTAKILLDKALSLSAKPSEYLELQRLILRYCIRAHEKKLGGKIAKKIAELLSTHSTDLISTKERCRSLNEVGNYHRISGNRLAALELYRSAELNLGEDFDSNDARILSRNIAIVLRELNRHSEAASRLKKLRETAIGDDVIEIAGSELMCYLEVDDLPKCRSLLEETLPRIYGRRTSDSVILPFVTVAGAALLALQEFHKARKMLSYFEHEFERSSNLLGQILLQYSEMKSAMDNVAFLKSVEMLHSFFMAFTLRLTSVPLEFCMMGIDLHDALVESNNLQKASEFARRLEERLVASDGNMPWQFNVLLAEHALVATRYEDALAYLEKACEAAYGFLKERVADGDKPSLMSRSTLLIERLFQIVVTLTQVKEMSVPPKLTVAIADLQASVVCSERLTYLKESHRNILKSEVEYLGETTDQRFAACQVCKIGTRVFVVASNWSARDLAECTIHEIATPFEECLQILRGIRKLVSIALPNDDLSFSDISGFNELKSEMGEIFLQLDSSLRLRIVSNGPMDQLLFSVLLLEVRGIAFAPSLASFVNNQGGWRKLLSDRVTLFDFVCWFRDEPSVNVQALKHANTKIQELLSGHSWDYDGAIGSDADKGKLESAFGGVDIVRVACHGRRSPNGSGVDLLVADSGLLPPSSQWEIGEDFHEKHVMRLETLEYSINSPTLVFSTACESAFSAIGKNGEQVGLYRNLMLAGVSTLIAPLWPVPIESIQRMSVVALAKIFSDRKMLVTEVIDEIKFNYKDLGIQPLAAFSLIINSVSI